MRFCCLIGRGTPSNAARSIAVTVKQVDEVCVIAYQEPLDMGAPRTSRQDDRSQAVLLFGTRVQPSDLEPIGDSTPLIESGAAYDLTGGLATDLGLFVDGSPDEEPN